jgi:hypothetical protein
MAGSLGVSALVCLLNNGDHGNTETALSLLGPFRRLNSPRVENGGSIVRSEMPGARLAGRPLREPGSRTGGDEPPRQVHDRCRWSLCFSLDHVYRMEAGEAVLPRPPIK